MTGHGVLPIWFALGIGLVLVALVIFVLDSREQELVRRIRGLGTDDNGPARRGRDTIVLVLGAAGRLGEALRGRLLSEKDAADLERTLAASGYEPRRVLPLFMTAKVLCLFLIPILTFAVLSFAGYHGNQRLYGAAVAIPVGMMAPNWCVSFLRKSFIKSLRTGLPDALDLFVVCAEAGLGLEMAIDRVAREMQGFNRPIASELAMLGHELRILPDRKTALSNLAERTRFEGLKRLSATLAQTLQYGTPLGQGLRVLSAEMRRERVIKAEERAVRLPTLLTIPMIMFILPCLFIVLIGPAVLQMMESMGDSQ